MTLDAAWKERETMQGKVNDASGGISDFEIEEAIFKHMHPATPNARHDLMALWQYGSLYNASFFVAEGAAKLLRSPLQVVGEEQKKMEGHGMLRHSLRPMTDSETKTLNVLFIQRRKENQRWIANFDDAVDWILKWQHQHGKVRVALLVVAMERLHPITQWLLAEQTQIMVGVTGAALAWAAFMAPGSVVLDNFPPNSNFCTEGWSNPVSHYGGLSRLAGIHHACLVHPAELQGPPLGDGDNEHLSLLEVQQRLGGLWHGQNIRLDMPKFQKYFEEAVHRSLLSFDRNAS
eukprot:gnl/MRDRNA2_/MRDRNA2_215948_c0_seq1.p1 gnl/MRDRNA2_/MRDRNA2_215948_c0~~gnl/MRDRNA2_/MRDRNA2_215948_c0_seq1.p1  ORF type:complete len:308 (-),score=49.66 gnl/MRDRNA2_/MRDRNA2_215948_c0_seq1:386-1255(-)